MDTSQKRDRDRKNRQRRQDKEVRRRERSERKRNERFRDQYTSLVAHDLANPLHSLMVVGQVLERSPAPALRVQAAGG